MNLQANIEFSRILWFGGPGSGCRGPNCGRPAGSVETREVHLTKATGKAWSGKQTALHSNLSKQEVGVLGENITIAYLKSLGMKDARALNAKVNNFPVDLVQNHDAIEVKTGLVSNGPSAQQWRATIGQPGKAESEWLKRTTTEQKRRWNEKKQAAILARKTRAVRELSRELGRPVKDSTIALLLNPDKRTVDVYRFSGFHLRIGWSGAQKNYVGSYKY